MTLSTVGWWSTEQDTHQAAVAAAVAALVEAPAVPLESDPELSFDVEPSSEPEELLPPSEPGLVSPSAPDAVALLLE